MRLDDNANFMFEMQVENNINIDIYVVLCYLGSCWQVQNILRRSHEVISPPKKELKFTGISKKLKITTHQHQGEIRHFEAIIKVVVTSLLKFPKFGDPAKKNAINRTTSHHTKVETARSGRASQVLSF